MLLLGPFECLLGLITPPPPPPPPPPQKLPHWCEVPITL